MAACVKLAQPKVPALRAHCLLISLPGTPALGQLMEAYFWLGSSGGIGDSLSSLASPIPGMFSVCRMRPLQAIVSGEL